jgi:hypothetical protein
MIQLTIASGLCEDLLYVFSIVCERLCAYDEKAGTIIPDKRAG